MYVLKFIFLLPKSFIRIFVLLKISYCLCKNRLLQSDSKHPPFRFTKKYNIIILCLNVDVLIKLLSCFCWVFLIENESIQQKLRQM